MLARQQRAMEHRQALMERQQQIILQGEADLKALLKRQAELLLINLQLKELLEVRPPQGGLQMN